MIDKYGQLIRCPYCFTGSVRKMESDWIKSHTRLKCNNCGMEFKSNKVEDWNKKGN